MKQETLQYKTFQPEFGRVSWLPEKEQVPFTEWLCGQTRPMILGLPLSDQDGYYPWDYKRWKSSLPVID